VNLVNALGCRESGDERLMEEEGAVERKKAHFVVRQSEELMSGELGGIVRPGQGSDEGEPCSVIDS
jgi:hypothetical protein